LAQAESFLPALVQDLGITQQKLAILQGEYPRTKTYRTQESDYYLALEPVPSGLPSDLLDQRPDIRAAEMRLRGLSARIGVAKAVRFPQISLTGNFGYVSEDLNDLFSPETELWNIATGIVQPVFNAGKLAASQRAAEARYAQGVAEYAKTVLTAFSEVEGALLTRKQQLERRKRVMVFLEEARATQQQAQQRYERGLTDYLTVLEAQQTRFGAEENLILVDLAIYTNRVRLHRALGGGWENLIQEDLQ
jgi:multidrug efflux system outer membrane protein